MNGGRKEGVDFTAHNSGRREARQAVVRARGIARARFFSTFLWAALYFLAVNAYVIELVLEDRLYSSGLLLSLLPYARSLLAPMLVVCLHGVMRRIIAGERFAAGGLLEPFGRAGHRSVGRFLRIAFAAVAAFYVRDGIMHEMAVWLHPMTMPESLDIFSLVSAFSWSPMAAWERYPHVLVPAYLMLTWSADFFCIHSAQTQGRGPAGSIHTLGLAPKTMLAEIRLLLRWPLPAAALLCAVYLYLAARLDASSAVLPSAGLLLRLGLLCIGLGYARLSAIARTLLVMGQPRAALVPPPLDPAYVAVIDDLFRQELASRLAQAGEDGRPGGEGQEPDRDVGQAP